MMTEWKDNKDLLHNCLWMSCQEIQLLDYILMAKHVVDLYFEKQATLSQVGISMSLS